MRPRIICAVLVSLVSVALPGRSDLIIENAGEAFTNTLDSQYQVTDFPATGLITDQGFIAGSDTSEASFFFSFDPVLLPAGSTLNSAMLTFAHSAVSVTPNISGTVTSVVCQGVVVFGFCAPFGDSPAAVTFGATPNVVFGEVGTLPNPPFTGLLTLPTSASFGVPVDLLALGLTAADITGGGVNVVGAGFLTASVVSVDNNGFSAQTFFDVPFPTANFGVGGTLTVDFIPPPPPPPPPSVPEPASVALLGTGLAALAGVVRRKSRA